MEFLAESVSAVSLEKPVDDVEDEEDSEDENTPNATDTTSKKKKKKKKKSKAKKAEPVVTPPLSRILGGSTDYFIRYGQTNPPTIPVCNIWRHMLNPFNRICWYV